MKCLRLSGLIDGIQCRKHEDVNQRLLEKSECRERWLSGGLTHRIRHKDHQIVPVCKLR